MSTELQRRGGVSACAVPWCTGIGPGDACAIHATRPVHKGEDRETWDTRVRVEDRAATRAAERAALGDAAVKKRLGR